MCIPALRCAARPAAVAALFSLLLWTAPRARAQCPQDVLPSGCCTGSPVLQPLVTPFPAVTIGGGSKLLCFNACSATSSNMGNITVSAHTPLAGKCGVYSATVTGPFTAAVNLHYARKYTMLPPGPTLDVYRFVALGNLTTPGSWNCNVDLGTASTFLYGYVDYAFSLAGGACQFLGAALVLGHNCSQFIHNSGAGCIPTLNPGFAHTGASAVVAPGANFTANTVLTPPQGATAAMRIRSLDLVAGVCQAAEPIATASLTNNPPLCPCIAPGPGQYTPQALQSLTMCGSVLVSAVLCPFNLSLPPASFFPWSLGQWAPPLFPGRAGGTRVWLSEGYAIYFPPPGFCEQIRQAVYYGAELHWGPAGGIDQKVDWVDNWMPAGNLPVIGGFGSGSVQNTRTVSLY